MQRFERTFSDLRKSHGQLESIDLLERYVESGGPEALAACLARQPQHWWIGTLLIGANPPGQLDDYDRRLLALAIACGSPEIVTGWLAKVVEKCPALIDHGLADLAQAHGDPALLDAALLACGSAVLRNGRVTEVGERLLALTPERLEKAVRFARQPGFWYRGQSDLLRLFVYHAPDRQEHIFDLTLKQNLDEGRLCQVLLSTFGDRFEARAAELFRRDRSQRQVGKMLVELNPERYRPEFEVILDEYTQGAGRFDYEWLLKYFGERAVAPLLKLLLPDHEDQMLDDQSAINIVRNLAKRGGSHARPALLQVLSQTSSLDVQVETLKALIDLNDPSLTQTLEEAIERGMSRDARVAAKFAALALRVPGGKLRDRLWADLAGKSKLVRAAAAEAIAGGDPEALDRAAALLLEKTKEARWGAVLVLAKLDKPEAIDVLLGCFKRETDADIRDEISRSLRSAGVGIEQIVQALGPVDLAELRARAAQLKQAPPDWANPQQLPALKLVDGTEAGTELSGLLLYRQSRQKEPIPDPEVAAVYKLIDRQFSGDFAHKLLDAFLASDAGKNGAWAMITAGLLGDNRVVTALAAKVRAWADDFEQKLGEWGIEALSLNGSIPALASLHSIAEKFKDNPRRKFAVIGEAAQNAIELAAKRMGLSMDELGDALVPNLGFEPGRPRVIEAGKRRIEATIGLDFKVAMKDLETGKRVASIPRTAPPEVQNQFKGLGKLMVETAKSQSARLERLMVRQHRWPTARWKELFLDQPILFPFAVRLVWGAFDESGKLVAMFRALPDRTLTQADDEPCELAASAVGIVHPLEIAPEQRKAWQTHLSDYEIEPPFAQMDRPVMTVPDEMREMLGYEGLRGNSMNGFGFRSRAEKSGWTRGPVIDSGMVSSFRKRFDALNVDAFVIIDGLPIYADPTATVTVQDVLFLPRDATPENFNEKRIKLGLVPAMAFSESVGDLMRIFGKA